MRVDLSWDSRITAIEGHAWKAASAVGVPSLRTMFLRLIVYFLRKFAYWFRAAPVVVDPDVTIVDNWSTLA